MTAREWDQLFNQRQTWGRWPDTRFVEWFMRTYGHRLPDDELCVLELGCGFGAQLRFLQEEGVDYVGVDGSPMAVQASRLLLEQGSEATVNDRVYQAELETFDFAGGPWDCIVDVCTLQHLPPGVNAQVVQRAFKALVPGGYLFSKWRKWDQFPGDDRPLEPNGLFARELPQLFPGFTRNVSVETVQAEGGTALQHWIIEAQRPLE